MQKQVSLSPLDASAHTGILDSPLRGDETWGVVCFFLFLGLVNISVPFANLYNNLYFAVKFRVCRCNNDVEKDVHCATVHILKSQLNIIKTLLVNSNLMCQQKVHILSD